MSHDEGPRLRSAGNTDPDADAVYFTPTAAHRHLGLYSLGVGWQLGATAPMQGRILNCYAAVVVSRGRGHLHTARSGSHPIRAPMIFWLFPGVAHTYAPDAGGWTEQWVLIDGFSARAYEDLGYLRRDAPVAELGPATPQQELLDTMIIRAADPGPQLEVELAVLAHQLVTAGGAAPADDSHAVADQLVAALQRDACQPIDVAEHARRSGVSVPALRAAVRERTGATPKQLVLRTRISRAKALLGGTDMLIAQVAREIGYDDPAYFSRVFTRLAGTSPAAFRAEQRRAPT